jgi:hypothetical protein
MFKKIRLWSVVLFISSTTFSCSTLMQLNVFPVTKDVELEQQFDSVI